MADKASWGVASIAIAACLSPLLCCGAGAVCGCGYLFWDFSKHLGTYLFPKDGYVPVEGKLPLRAMLITQAYLGKTSLLLGMILSFVFSDEETGGPIWLFAFALPFILRSRWVEHKLLVVYGGSTLGMWDYIDSCDATLESLDEFSDGVQLVVMFVCDKLVHDHFVRSFLESNYVFVQDLAPIADFAHMYGLLALSLVLSQTMQFRLAGGGLVKGRRVVELQGFDEEAQEHVVVDHWWPVMAEAAGFSALASRLEKKVLKHSQGEKVVFLGFARVLIENVPSGLLASSFLMFKGVDSLFEQPITLISSVLSCFSIIKKGVETLQQLLRMVRLTPVKNCAGGAVAVCILACGLSSLGIGALILAKLYFIQECEHHMWEVTVGCFDL